MKATSAAVVSLGVVWLAASAGAQEAPVGERLSLSDAVTVARARQPATRAARADIEVARGMRLQAGLRANPVVTLERRQEPGGTDTFTDVGIEWPLELFRRGSRVAVANAQLAVAEQEEADARRQLAGDVAAAYGEVAGALREVTIMDEVLAAATKQLELLRVRAAQGATPTLDRDMVDVEVRKLQAERLVLVGRAERALVRLKRLLGLAPGAAITIAQSLEELVAGPDVESAQGATRPDVLAYESRVRAEQQRLVAARNESRPELTVFGSYMRMDAGFPQRGFAASGAVERVRGQFNYLSAGLMVTVPLWNRQQGNIVAATAAREGAEARLEAARLAAASEVAEAQAWNDQARRVLSVYADEIRPRARRNLDTVREAYQLGRSTVFDVLAEQRRYLDAERAYTLSLTEAFASRVSLRRATGDIR